MVKITFYETSWCKTCHEIKPIFRELAYIMKWQFEPIDVEKTDTEQSKTVTLVPTIHIDDYHPPDALLNMLLASHVLQKILHFAQANRLLVNPHSLLTILYNPKHCPDITGYYDCPCTNAQTQIEQTGTCTSNLFLSTYKHDTEHKATSTASGPWFARAMANLKDLNGWVATKFGHKPKEDNTQSNSEKKGEFYTKERPSGPWARALYQMRTGKPFIEEEFQARDP